MSRPKNENIVVVSEKEYNEMVKAKRTAGNGIWWLEAYTKNIKLDEKNVRRINNLLKDIKQNGAIKHSEN